MWPFTKRTTARRTASVVIDGITASWTDEGWSFSDGVYDFTMYDNDLLDTNLIAKLPLITNWLDSLSDQIDAKIDQELADEKPSQDERAIVSIDVSHLAEKDQINVSYACEQWADVGVNIVITNGKITEIYGGD